MLDKKMKLCQSIGFNSKFCGIKWNDVNIEFNSIRFERMYVTSALKIDI